MKSRLAGFALNALLRASIAAFLVDVLRHPQDPRYAGKAIPIRNLVVVGSLSLLFPFLHLRSHGRRWQRYPVWSDNLYLSIFWLDMAGNAFNLYDRYTHFDLIPHLHGSGALAAVLRHAFGAPPGFFDHSWMSVSQSKVSSRQLSGSRRDRRIAQAVPCRFALPGPAAAWEGRTPAPFGVSPVARRVGGFSCGEGLHRTTRRCPIARLALKSAWTVC